MSKKANKRGRKSGVRAFDYIGLRGSFKIALCDAQGRPLETYGPLNTVVTRGRREVLDIIRTGGHTSLFGWMAVGTGNTGAATGDTLLQSEVDRNAIVSFDTTNLTANPPSWAAICSWNTDEANTTLGEVGIFNTSTANTQTLLARATFSTISKATTNTLSITYTISN